MNLQDAKGYWAALGAAITKAETEGKTEINLVEAAGTYYDAARAELDAAIAAAERRE